MRNSTFEDVERVKKGEFVPNVMFTTNGGTKIHMKECVLESVFNLHEGQKIFETADGKLYIIHLSNLLPIKKHSFSSNDPKKVKRKPVKGSRKYVKVACSNLSASDLAKKQGFVTFFYPGTGKYNLKLSPCGHYWCKMDGSLWGSISIADEVFAEMYAPVEISPQHQASISTDLSKSVNQFAEDAKLGEVMRKAGWKINDGQIPCHNSQPVRVIMRNGVVPRAACIAEDWRWNYTETDSDIIAYKIIG